MTTNLELKNLTILNYISRHNGILKTKDLERFILSSPQRKSLFIVGYNKFDDIIKNNLVFKRIELSNKRYYLTEKGKSYLKRLSIK